jgi:hypothetical protein
LIFRNLTSFWDKPLKKDLFSHKGATPRERVQEVARRTEKKHEEALNILHFALLAALRSIFLIPS